LSHGEQGLWAREAHGGGAAGERPPRLSVKPVGEKPRSRGSSTAGRPQIPDRLDLGERIHALCSLLGARAEEELLGAFFRDRAGRLGRALVRNDTAALRGEVQRLERDTSLLGIRGITGLCDEILHERSEQGTSEHVVALFEDLGRELDRAERAVRAWR